MPKIDITKIKEASGSFYPPALGEAAADAIGNGSATRQASRNSAPISFVSSPAPGPRSGTGMRRRMNSSSWSRASSCSSRMKEKA